jgi:hypothetical protein
MTAKQKLESLTTAWYGFFFISTIVGLVSDFGIIKAVFSALWLAVTTFVVWFIGRRLVAKSAVTRVLMLVISGIMAVGCTISAAKFSWMFIHEWSLWMLLTALWSAAALTMYVRSWRTLTDNSVKAYFG